MTASSVNLTTEMLQAGIEAANAMGEEPAAIVPEVALEAPVEMHPTEEAAMKFTKLLPYVKMLGQAMPSQKGLIRVMHAFAEFPLGKEKPRLLTDAERQLFHILQELQGYKSTVIQAILQKNMEMEHLKQQAVEVPTAEQENKDVGTKEV